MCSRDVACFQWGTNWIFKYYLVVGLPGYRYRGLGSIPGATRFSEKSGLEICLILSFCRFPPTIPYSTVSINHPVIDSVWLKQCAFECSDSWRSSAIWHVILRPLGFCNSPCFPQSSAPRILPVFFVPSMWQLSYPVVAISTLVFLCGVLCSEPSSGYCLCWPLKCAYTRTKIFMFMFYVIFSFSKLLTEWEPSMEPSHILRTSITDTQQYWNASVCCYATTFP
jgi:hypothetical protein